MDFIGKSATADTSSGMPEAFLGQAHLPWVTWDDARRKGAAGGSHPASAELGPTENGIALRQAVGGGFGAARLRLSDAAEAMPSDSLNSQLPPSPYSSACITRFWNPYWISRILPGVRWTMRIRINCSLGSIRK